MVFCNIEAITETEKLQRVTILILIDGFLQYDVDLSSFLELLESQSLF